MQTGALKAVLAMAGIFVAGGIAGGVGAIAWDRQHAHSPSEQEYFDHQLRRLEASLELTAEQVECMRPVMQNFMGRVRLARSHAFTEVREVWCDINAQLERELTPHQLKKFRKIQALDLERWEREHDRRCPPDTGTEAKPETKSAAPAAVNDDLPPITLPDR
jgi:hypothetical protein